VVYVATLNNSVYAFDADSGLELWTANYGPSTPFDDLCTDSSYQVATTLGAGIVSTPVIDSGAGILYFVTKNGDGSPSKPFALNLHAVDFTTGIEETSLGSPVTILPPTGPTFLPQYQMNRPGLLLNNGVLYVGLGSTGCKGLKGFRESTTTDGFWATARSASLRRPRFSSRRRPRTMRESGRPAAAWRRQQRKHLL